MLKSYVKEAPHLGHIEYPSGVISSVGKCYGKDVDFGWLVGRVIVNCGVGNAVERYGNLE